MKTAGELYEQSTELFEIEDYCGASLLLSQACELDPGEVILQEALAISKVYQGQYNQAVEVFRSVRDINDLCTHGLISYIRALLSTGVRKKVLGLLSRFLALPGCEVEEDAYIHVIHSLSQHSHFGSWRRQICTKGLEISKRLTVEFKDNPEGFFAVGYFYTGLNNNVEALPWILKAIEMESRPDFWGFLGGLYSELGKPSQAFTAFCKVPIADHDDIDSLQAFLGLAKKREPALAALIQVRIEQLQEADEAAVLELTRHLSADG